MAPNYKVQDELREELQQKVRSDGLKNLSDEELIEFLLFHTVRFGDVTVLAKRLLRKFHTVHGVLDASYNELVSIGGISPTTATFLSSIPDLLLRYSSDGVESRPVMSVEEIVRFMSVKFIGTKGERFFAVYFDESMHMLNSVLLGESSAGEVVVDNRKIISSALNCEARNVIIVHNHPNMVLKPSADDIESTYNLIKLLREVDIHLIDHIIMCGSKYWSMAREKKLRHMFDYFIK